MVVGLSTCVFVLFSVVASHYGFTYESAILNKPMDTVYTSPVHVVVMVQLQFQGTRKQLYPIIVPAQRELALLAVVEA